MISVEGKGQGGRGLLSLFVLLGSISGTGHLVRQ